MVLSGTSHDVVVQYYAVRDQEVGFVCHLFRAATSSLVNVVYEDYLPESGFIYAHTVLRCQYGRSLSRVEQPAQRRHNAAHQDNCRLISR